MPTLADMRAIARARVTDAVVLTRAGRYDAAIFLCGYAVEVSLKARVSRTLGWTEFPGEPREWQRHHAFLKVHDLRLLAKWTGYELQWTGPSYDAKWDEVCEWNPESRYQPPASVPRGQALSMVRSTRALVGLLNPR